MLATALALIGAAYSGRDRSVALAVWGATTAASVAVGPLVGGALIEAINWESIFYVNVPIGIITALLVRRGVPESRDTAASGRPDYAGLVTMAGSAALLVVALFRGNDEGWSSALIIGLFAGSALLLGAFIAIERVGEQPLLDLGMFRKPSTWGASLGILATAVSVFAMLTFFVFYFQNALGYDPLHAGLRLLPLTIAAAAAQPGAGPQVAAAAEQAFVAGFDEIQLVAAIVAFAGAALALVRPRDFVAQPAGEVAAPAAA